MNNLINLLQTIDQNIIKTMRYKKNETIFYEGDECKCIAILMSGEVSISTYSFKGDEIIFQSLKQGQMFGNNLLFASDTKYKGSVICKSDSTICFIYKDDLLNVLQNNKEFLLCYLNIESNFTIGLNAKIKMLSFNKIEDRILYLLYINNGVYKYTSISELAKQISSSREATTRIIKQLEINNKIIKSKKELRYNFNSNKDDLFK